jgi:hypothetical protein
VKQGTANMSELTTKRFVFVVSEEINGRVTYKETFDSYSLALNEYSLRTRRQSKEKLVSLQKVEKISERLDNPAKMLYK